jgi:hypothetical protein
MSRGPTKPAAGDVRQYPATVVDVGDPFRCGATFDERLAKGRRTLRRMYGLMLSIDGPGVAVPDGSEIPPAVRDEGGPPG